MRPIGTLAALALLAVAAACAKPAAPTAPEAQKALIGASRTQILACAGQPAAASEVGGLEYLTYRRAETAGVGHFQAVPRIPVIGSLATGGSGYRVTCEATFVFKDGAVEALSFRTEPTQDEAASAEICSPLVARCLSP